MKKNMKNLIKNIFIVCSTLNFILFACKDSFNASDDPADIVSSSETKNNASSQKKSSSTNENKSKSAKVSVAAKMENNVRTALPTVTDLQDFDSFLLSGNSAGVPLSLVWTKDNDKTAYTKMTETTIELDSGKWSFTLTASKGGVIYKSIVEKMIVDGENSLFFALTLDSLKKSGKGNVNISLSLPENVLGVKAVLSDVSENLVSNIDETCSFSDGHFVYSASDIPSGIYIIVFNLYADTEKTLLLGKWREYAGITSDVISSSEIAITADTLDEVYTIAYELNGGMLKGNWSGNYTRKTICVPTAYDIVKDGKILDKWYTDESLTHVFDATTCTGNLTLYAKWRNLYADEVVSAIRNGLLAGTNENPSTVVIEGEISTSQLKEIASAMQENKCYLSLDLSAVSGLSAINTEFKQNLYLCGIIVPDSLESIGDYAFWGCSGLTSMTIPESVVSIGDSAFSGCSGLTGMTIPDGVTSIGNSAFSGCSGLTSITIPDGVTSIGDYAFRGCSGLTSMTIPESVTRIGDSAFNGCSGLTEITIPFVGLSSTATGYEGLFGRIFGGDSYTGGTYTIMCYDCYCYIPNSLKKVTVLGGELSNGAFSGCSGLTNVKIPESVTSIGEFAFSGCSGLTNVKIPESVTSIGNHAFYGCSGLTSVMIPKSVTRIGLDAFEGCGGPMSVTLAEGLTSIWKSAFSGCSGLTSVKIPESVTSIGESAFRGCSGLTSVRIPESVTSIGESAFRGCSGLTNVKIPESVTSIRESTFYGCSGLTSVKIPESVTSIGSYAFRGCSGLTNVKIPESVTSIEDDAFRGCSGLTNVKIPENTTTIGAYVFSGCSGLTSMTIPESVTSIGKFAFSGCSGLTSMKIPESVTSIGDSAFSGCSGLTSIKIPESVTSIGESAFNGCSGLTSVTIPESVMNIRESAFSGCNGLTEMTIPFVGSSASAKGREALFGYIFGRASYTGGISTRMYYSSSSYETYYIPSSLKKVTVLGDQLAYGAFYECIGLTSVTIAENVTSIGESAFYGCSGLTSVTIAESVTSIGKYAFTDCSELTSVYYDGSIESWIAIPFDDFNSNPCWHGSDLYFHGNKITELVIPDGVTSIGNHAFSGCIGLTSVIIPESVTSIGAYVFSGCSGLTEITIPFVGSTPTTSDKFAYIFGSIPAALRRVTVTGGNISSSAFAGCSGLTSVKIPETVTSIGYDAFRGCSGLTNMTIPESVTSIGSYAFSGCSGLTNVKIPESVTSIGESAFSGCSGLTNVKIPESVTSIRKSTFYGCRGLTSVTIPESVTSIGDSAFQGCSGLTSVKIPESVTSIGYDAFRGCRGLTSVKIPESVTSIGINAFDDCSGLTSITIPFVGSSPTSTDKFNYIFSREVPASLRSVTVTGGIISYNAFSKCTGLTDITISSGVTKIKSYAFEGCSGLTSITISENVMDIDKSALRGCNALKEIYVNSLNTYWKICSSFTLTDVELYINGKLLSGDLIIGNDVTEIPENGFKGISALTSITIPDSVVSIGNNAFSDCTGLTSMRIPASVTSIGRNIFSGCTGISKLYVDSLRSYWLISSGSTTNPIWDGAKLYINGEIFPSNFVLPNDVVSIPANAFKGLNITDLTIPASVTNIDANAFSECTEITNLYVNSVEYYWNVLLSNPLNPIWNGAKLYVNGIKLAGEFTIPNTITTIPANAFKGITSLTSVTIPNSVTTIEAGAFNGCSNLTSVTIPFVGKTANAIGKEALFGYIFGTDSYDGGTEISQSYPVYSGNKVSAYDKVSYYIPSSLQNITVLSDAVPFGGFSNCSNIKEINFKFGLASVAEEAFYNCSNLELTIDNLEQITLGNNSLKGVKVKITDNSVTKIQKGIFKSTGIAVLELPSNLQSIENSAFKECTGLTSITIPNSVTSIGESAFYGCSSLTSVTIPEGVTSIEGTAFYGCSSLTSVTIPEGVTSIGWKAFYRCSSLTSVTIPEGVRSIGECAFYGCSGLTSVTLPVSVTSIGKYAFDIFRCSSELSYVTSELSYLTEEKYKGLENVYYEGGIEDWLAISFSAYSCCIGSDLYIQGDKLTKLVIPENVTSIGEYAFCGCSSLTNVVVANSVRSIGFGSFAGCTSLKEMTIPFVGESMDATDSNIGFDYIFGDGRVPDSLSIVTIAGGEIMERAFISCSNLRTVILLDGVTSIGKTAFEGCSGLTSVTIPDTVTSIGSWAFSECSELTSVTIPASVMEIGQKPFGYCKNLKTIDILGRNSWKATDYNGKVYRTGLELTAYMLKSIDYEKYTWTRF